MAFRSPSVRNPGPSIRATAGHRSQGLRLPSRASAIVILACSVLLGLLGTQVDATGLVPYVPTFLYQAPCTVKPDRRTFDIIVLNNGQRNADCEVEVLVSYRDDSPKAPPKVAVHLETYDGSVSWNFEMRNGWSYAFNLGKKASIKAALYPGTSAKGNKVAFAILPQASRCVCKLAAPLVTPATTVFQGAAVLKLKMPLSQASRPGVVLKYKLEGACGSLDAGVYLYPITITACGTSRLTAWASAPGCVDSLAYTRIFTVRCYRTLVAYGDGSSYGFDPSDDTYNAQLDEAEDDAESSDATTPASSSTPQLADDDGTSYFTAWGDSELGDDPSTGSEDAPVTDRQARRLSGSKCKKYGKYCGSKYKHKGSGRYRCRVRKMEGCDDYDRCDKYKDKCKKDKYYYKYKGKYGKYCKDKKNQTCRRYPCLPFPRYEGHGSAVFAPGEPVAPYSSAFSVDYRYGHHGFASLPPGRSWPSFVPGLGSGFNLADGWNSYADHDDYGRDRRHNGHGFSLELLGGRRNCKCGGSIKVGYARPPHHGNIDDDHDHDDYDRGHYRGNHGDGRRGGGYFMRKCLVTVSRRGLSHLSYDRADQVLAYSRNGQGSTGQPGLPQSVNGKRLLQEEDKTVVAFDGDAIASEVQAIHASTISRHLIHVVDGHTYELDLADIPQGASVNLFYSGHPSTFVTEDDVDATDGEALAAFSDDSQNEEEISGLIDAGAFSNLAASFDMPDGCTTPAAVPTIDSSDSNDESGGAIVSVTSTTPGSVVYATFDGSDPRNSKTALFSSSPATDSEPAYLILTVSAPGCHLVRAYTAVPATDASSSLQLEDSEETSKEVCISDVPTASSDAQTGDAESPEEPARRALRLVTDPSESSTMDPASSQASALALCSALDGDYEEHIICPVHCAREFVRCLGGPRGKVAAVATRELAPEGFLCAGGAIVGAYTYQGGHYCSNNVCPPSTGSTSTTTTTKKRPGNPNAKCTLVQSADVAQEMLALSSAASTISGGDGGGTGGTGSGNGAPVVQGQVVAGEYASNYYDSTGSYGGSSGCYDYGCGFIPPTPPPKPSCTPSRRPSATKTRTPLASKSRTAQRSCTPTRTASRSPTPTRSVHPSCTASKTASRTASKRPYSHTPTPSRSMSRSPSPTPSPKPSQNPYCPLPDHAECGPVIVCATDYDHPETFCTPSVTPTASVTPVCSVPMNQPWSSMDGGGDAGGTTGAGGGSDGAAAATPEASSGPASAGLADVGAGDSTGAGGASSGSGSSSGGGSGTSGGSSMSDLVRRRNRRLSEDTEASATPGGTTTSAWFDHWGYNWRYDSGKTVGDSTDGLCKLRPATKGSCTDAYYHCSYGQWKPPPIETGRGMRCYTDPKTGRGKLVLASDDRCDCGYKSPSATPTQTRTSSRTPTSSISETRTPSPTHTSSISLSQTRTGSRTASRTPSVPPSCSNSHTGSSTRTQSRTQSATQTRTPTETRTSSQTRTPSVSYSSTVSATQTRTRTASRTATTTRTATATRTSTSSRTPSPSMSESMLPSDTPYPTRTRTPSRTGTQSGTASPTASATATETASGTASVTETRTRTPSRTQTTSPTHTRSRTPSPSASDCAEPSPSPTPVVTCSRPPSPTCGPPKWHPMCPPDHFPYHFMLPPAFPWPWPDAPAWQYGGNDVIPLPPYMVCGERSTDYPQEDCRECHRASDDFLSTLDSAIGAWQEPPASIDDEEGDSTGGTDGSGSGEDTEAGRRQLALRKRRLQAQAAEEDAIILADEGDSSAAVDGLQVFDSNPFFAYRRKYGPGVYWGLQPQLSILRPARLGACTGALYYCNGKGDFLKPPQYVPKLFKCFQDPYRGAILIRDDDPRCNQECTGPTPPPKPTPTLPPATTCKPLPSQGPMCAGVLAHQNGNNNGNRLALVCGGSVNFPPKSCPMPQLPGNINAAVAHDSLVAAEGALAMDPVVASALVGADRYFHNGDQVYYYFGSSSTTSTTTTTTNGDVTTVSTTSSTSSYYYYAGGVGYGPGGGYGDALGLVFPAPAYSCSRLFYFCSNKLKGPVAQSQGLTPNGVMCWTDPSTGVGMLIPENDRRCCCGDGDYHPPPPPSCSPSPSPYPSKSASPSVCSASSTASRSQSATPTPSRVQGSPSSTPTRTPSTTGTRSRSPTASTTPSPTSTPKKRRPCCKGSICCISQCGTQYFSCDHAKLGYDGKGEECGCTLDVPKGSVCFDDGVKGGAFISKSDARCLPPVQPTCDPKETGYRCIDDVVAANGGAAYNPNRCSSLYHVCLNGWPLPIQSAPYGTLCEKASRRLVQSSNSSCAYAPGEFVTVITATSAPGSGSGSSTVDGSDDENEVDMEPVYVEAKVELQGLAASLARDDPSSLTPVRTSVVDLLNGEQANTAQQGTFAIGDVFIELLADDSVDDSADTAPSGGGTVAQDSGLVIDSPPDGLPGDPIPLAPAQPSPFDGRARLLLGQEAAESGDDAVEEEPEPPSEELYGLTSLAALAREQFTPAGEALEDVPIVALENAKIPWGKATCMLRVRVPSGSLRRRIKAHYAALAASSETQPSSAEDPAKGVLDAVSGMFSEATSPSIAQDELTTTPLDATPALRVRLLQTTTITTGSSTVVTALSAQLAENGVQVAANPLSEPKVVIPSLIVGTTPSAATAGGAPAASPQPGTSAATDTSSGDSSSSPLYILALVAGVAAATTFLVAVALVVVLRRRAKAHREAQQAEAAPSGASASAARLPVSALPLAALPAAKTGSKQKAKSSARRNSQDDKSGFGRSRDSQLSRASAYDEEGGADESQPGSDRDDDDDDGTTYNGTSTVAYSAAPSAVGATRAAPAKKTSGRRGQPSTILTSASSIQSTVGTSMTEGASTMLSAAAATAILRSPPARQRKKSAGHAAKARRNADGDDEEARDAASAYSHHPLSVPAPIASMVAARSDGSADSGLSFGHEGQASGKSKRKHGGKKGRSGKTHDGRVATPSAVTLAIAPGSGESMGTRGDMGAPDVRGAASAVSARRSLSRHADRERSAARVDSGRSSKSQTRAASSVAPPTVPIAPRPASVPSSSASNNSASGKSTADSSGNSVPRAGRLPLANPLEQ